MYNTEKRKKKVNETNRGSKISPRVDQPQKKQMVCPLCELMKMKHKTHCILETS